jgi:hypothetical protein
MVENLTRRAWAAGILLAFAAPGSSIAQPAGAVEPDITQEQEIVVTARRIGIPFWTVSGPATTIILLPSDGPIPDEATGSIAALSSTLRQADRILYPGRTSISLSPFKMLGYYVQWRRMSSLPKGVTIAGVLTPHDYQRLLALKQRGLLKDGFQRTHPFPLSVQLKRKAFGEPKPGRGILQFVNQIAEEHGIRRVPPAEASSKPIAKAFFRSDPKEYVPCLRATIDLIEAGPTASAYQARKERRIRDVLASPASRAFEECIPPALRQTDRPDVRAQVRSMMDDRQVTVAVVPLISLAERGGILEDLRGAGYVIKGPSWN